MTRRILIAGCGFVGLETARCFANAGWDVLGCTHSEESAARLASRELRVMACDISDRAALAARAELQGLDAIIHCASSGRGGAEEYQRVYLEGARNLAEVLRPALLLFTSSTSVYAQTDGAWVTEESPAKPIRETGRILRAAEELVLQSGGLVARVAGIYGPGRSVLLRKFFDGTATIEGDGVRWVNQAHRDDFAAALLFLVEQEARGIFNVSDDAPLPQSVIYKWLAQRFQKPLPPGSPIDLHRKRGWTHKRVSNQKLRTLGWAPRFTSFLQAVENDPRLLQAARP